jgi:hypothetical protein
MLVQGDYVGDFSPHMGGGYQWVVTNFPGFTFPPYSMENRLLGFSPSSEYKSIGYLLGIEH